MQKLSNRMQVLHKKFAEQWLVLFLVSGLFISTILKIAEIGPDVSDVIVIHSVWFLYSYDSACRNIHFWIFCKFVQSSWVL